MTVIKGISNFGTPYYTDEPRYERKNGQWVDTKAGVIEELEEIQLAVKNGTPLEELEEIKYEIGIYYTDCSLSVSDDENCKRCNDAMFGSVLGIVDKHIEKLKEGEEKHNGHIHRTDCLWYDESDCELRDCGECGMVDEMEGNDYDY